MARRQIQFRLAHSLVKAISRLNTSHRVITTQIVKSHQEHARPDDITMKYCYMGNEIADKAAQVALHHDLPQFLQMRDRLQQNEK